MSHARSLTLALVALVAAAPVPAAAVGTRAAVEPRPLEEGFLYAGVAPGFDFGGRSLPRALYADVLQAGYVMPSGIDLSFALSGMNFFPDEGEYAITQSRLQLAYRPILRDPLPVIQPYALIGTGLGGEGPYTCTREDGRRVCEREDWVGSLFGGAGVDLNAHLATVAGQQLVVYGGIQARYEWIFDHYRMPVVTFPIGLRLQ
jgi:hypothetical protein